MMEIETLIQSVKRVEQAGVDGLFDVEVNMHEQLKLIAPDLDVSLISVFKKVVNGEMVDIMSKFSLLSYFKSFLHSVLLYLNISRFPRVN
ncbi:uncharacterized protein DS421_18g615800 [Arachis hypogaea]|nr:uncharacterized protein DS421_18g615800 [Arachis hypogaea]